MSILAAIRRPKVYIPLGVVAVAVVALLSGGGAEQGPTNTVTVSRTDLTQTVSVTGRVVAADEAALAFERSGRVASVRAGVGVAAPYGGTLVELEHADLSAGVMQAEAALQAAQAQLADVKRGARPEDIAISEARVAAAVQALADAKQRLLDAARQSFTYADDAVRNRTDQFFSNPSGRTPALAIPVTDFQMKTDIESGRFILSDVLVAWAADLVGATAESAGLSGLATRSVERSATVKAYLDKVSLAVNALTANSSLSQTTIDGYKAAVAVARTNVNAGTDGLSVARGAVEAAEGSRSVAESELSLKRAGSSNEAIAIAEARVAEATAALLSARAQLGKTFLRAPFSGVVTKVEAKVGEIVAPNEPVVWMIGASFQIEANVPEADIAKVAVGNVATATLDAYGSDAFFPATVVAVDPAETLVDNVATYKVTLQFASPDARIKPGMTANLDVMTDFRPGALAVPVRSVTGRADGTKTVSVVAADGTVSERTVTTGIRGEGGLIEILSGLSDGEQVKLGL